MNFWVVEAVGGEDGQLGGVGLCLVPFSDGSESDSESGVWMGDAPIDCVWKLGPQLGATLKMGPSWRKWVPWDGPWSSWAPPHFLFALCFLMWGICRKLLPPCLSQCKGLCALKLCPKPSSLKFLPTRHFITVLESSYVGRVTLRVEGE